jgi:hypothetical protein
MIIYLNDIIIYLKTKKEHIKYVTAVLKILKKTDIRINNAKSVFHVLESGNPWSAGKPRPQAPIGPDPP